MNELADERLLQQFREWLAQARAEGERTLAEGGFPGQNGDRNGTPASASGDGVATPIGLYRLIEEFTALRQEVKLQTRGARGLEENAEKLSAALRQAIDALRSIEPREAAAAWSAGKGLALALAEMDESLDRGRRQLDKTIEAVLSAPAQETVAQVEEIWRSLPAYKRWFARGYQRAVCDALASASVAEREQAQLAALRDGYAMIQHRLRRLLAAEGILRIATVGEMVDPEQMIVLETVAADEPAGTVVEEVRRGYIWNGRLLRCAEVRAARVE